MGATEHHCLLFILKYVGKYIYIIHITFKSTRCNYKDTLRDFKFKCLFESEAFNPWCAPSIPRVRAVNKLWTVNYTVKTKWLSTWGDTKAWALNWTSQPGVLAKMATLEITDSVIQLCSGFLLTKNIISISFKILLALFLFYYSWQWDPENRVPLHSSTGGTFNTTDSKSGTIGKTL